jgi:ubiquinone/menaquinone biosynthesis C-methylase UbiE
MTTRRETDERPGGGVRLGALARHFVNRPGRAARNVAQVRRALEALGPGSPPRDALEVGCGAGAVAGWLATERGMAVVATDLDPREVAVAHARRPPGAPVRHAVMDASRMALRGDRFDLVVAQLMLHHVPDWPGALAEAGRLLRPGGHLVWVDFALPGCLARLLAPLSARAGVFSLAGVTAACAQAGLALVRHDGPGALGLGLHRALFRKGGTAP